MIKDIINILQNMESACPVESFTQMNTNLRGNLVLEWRWLQNGDQRKYSIELTSEGDDAMIDLIDHGIEMARKKIACLL